MKAYYMSLLLSEQNPQYPDRTHRQNQRDHKPSTMIFVSMYMSYLYVIGWIPVDIIQHQVGSPDQIETHPTSFGAQQKQEVLRVRTVKIVNQPLPLAGRCVSIESAEGVTHVQTQVLEQIQGLCIVGHYNHPAGTHILSVYT